MGVRVTLFKEMKLFERLLEQAAVSLRSLNFPEGVIG